MISPIGLDDQAAAEAVRRLVDQYRIRCLWFLRPDYYPSTPEEQLRALEYIERHADDLSRLDGQPRGLQKVTIGQAKPGSSGEVRLVSPSSVRSSSSAPARRA